MPRSRSPRPGVRFARVTSGLRIGRSRLSGVRGGVDVPVSIKRTVVLDAQSRRCGGTALAAESVGGLTVAASARSVSSDRYGDSMSIQGSRASAGYGRRRLRLLLRSFSASTACLFELDVCAGRRSAKRSPPRLGSSDGGRSAGLLRVEERPCPHSRRGHRQGRAAVFRLPARSAVLRRATAPSGNRRDNRDVVIFAGQRRGAL
jgi:hypothetical protein